MGKLDDNPYTPPTAVATPQATEHLPAGLNAGMPDKSLVDALLLILGTVVGGYAGNLLGTLASRLIWMIPGPLFQTSDLGEITHPLGIGLLVIGSFSGAWIGQYVGRCIRASAKKRSPTTV